MEKSLSDREVIEKHAMLSVGRVIQSWNKSGAWYKQLIIPYFCKGVYVVSGSKARHQDLRALLLLHPFDVLKLPLSLWMSNYQTFLCRV